MAIARVLVLALACTAVAQALPNGFLMAMLPLDGVANHIFPFSINPSTAAATALGDGDYIMANLVNTQNGGTYNPATKQVQFIGQSLTFADNATGPVPNPTMNFLVSVEANGEYTSRRLIAYGGLVYTARSDSTGKVYGMEQATTADAKIDIIEDTGLCTPFINTTATKGYLVGYAAVDTDSHRFYVAVKNGANGISLLTADTTGTGHLVSSVDLGTPSMVRLTLCFDTVSRGLYALERAAGASTTQINRIDPNTGKATLKATINGAATVGDCYGGTFFASGTNAGKAFIATVDLASGLVNQKPFDKVAPTSLVFFPQ